MPKNKPNVFDGQAIGASEFFQTHWQQAPYLFKQTGIDLSCLPDAEELFALAGTEGVQSRIVFTEDQRCYQAIYDEPDAWNEVAHHHPTLLVSDIEKWYPEARQLLAWFPFIKSWRFDDLMMSFAPEGASVGAHTDHYDVFLLQVQGSRQWSYDDQATNDPAWVSDSELAVIEQHQAEHTVELYAGDMLYLPPGVIHHGISTSSDCVTCSIGLRAPADAELLQAVMELATQDWPPSQRFTDDVNQLASHADIGTHEIQHLRTLFQNLSQADEATLARWFGQAVTQYRLFDDEPVDNLPSVKSDANLTLQTSPFAVLAYHIENQTSANLFVNGDAYQCSVQLAKVLCDQSEFQWQELKHLAGTEMSDLRLLHQLIEAGVLIKAPQN